MSPKDFPEHIKALLQCMQEQEERERYLRELDRSMCKVSFIYYIKPYWKLTTKCQYNLIMSLIIFWIKLLSFMHKIRLKEEKYMCSVVFIFILQFWLIKNPLCIQGSHRFWNSWKSTGILFSISRALEILEFLFKSWKKMNLFWKIIWS